VARDARISGGKVSFLLFCYEKEEERKMGSCSSRQNVQCRQYRRLRKRVENGEIFIYDPKPIMSFVNTSLTEVWYKLPVPESGWIKVVFPTNTLGKSARSFHVTLLAGRLHYSFSLLLLKHACFLFPFPVCPDRNLIRALFSSLQKQPL